MSNQKKKTQHTNREKQVPRNNFHLYSSCSIFIFSLFLFFYRFLLLFFLQTHLFPSVSKCSLSSLPLNITPILFEGSLAFSASFDFPFLFPFLSFSAKSLANHLTSHPTVHIPHFELIVAGILPRTSGCIDVFIERKGVNELSMFQKKCQFFFNISVSCITDNKNQPSLTSGKPQGY